MNAQVVTPELSQWIVEQAQAGCRPEDVLASMRASGWAEDVAVGALERTLQQFLGARPVASSGSGPSPRVPEPALLGSPNCIQAGDRPVTVLLTMRHPRVVVFGGLLSDEECDALVADAGPRLSRSETVVIETGGNEVNSSRTSQGMFFGRGETPLCARIEARTALERRTGRCS